MTAAEVLFLENGFKSTTVRQIAEEAGVSIGTVMAEGGKEALLVSVFDDWISAVHDNHTFPRNRPGPLEPGIEAAEAIAALVSPFIELFAGNMPLAREYGAILLRGSHGSGIFRSLAATLKTEFTSVMEQHGVPSSHATDTASAIYFAYLGVLLTWAGGAQNQHTVLEQLTSVVTSLLNTGGR